MKHIYFQFAETDSGIIQMKSGIGDSFYRRYVAYVISDLMSIYKLFVVDLLNGLKLTEYFIGF